MNAGQWLAEASVGTMIYMIAWLMGREHGRQKERAEWRKSLADQRSYERWAERFYHEQ